MLIKLKINDRATLAIKNKTKRIEIRANNKPEYSLLKENDLIEFSSVSYGTYYCLVEEVNYYKTLEELYMLEGTRYTTSSTNDYNEAINNTNKINGYADAIKENGVYAIHIKYLS